MIINAYAVLAAFIVALRALIGLLVVGAAFGGWRRCRSSLSPDERTSLEDRSYLVLSLGLALFWLNLAAWPLFYMLLQSYVPEWPGIMCIYGVTQIGASPYNTAPSRFLPTLLTMLQVAKPAVVFLSGTWFVLYLVNRRTRTAPLMKRLLAVLVALGALSLVDSVTEAAYLVIPKKEETLSVGCCTATQAVASSTRFLPTAWVSEGNRVWLAVAFYGINGFFVAALLSHALLLPRARTRRWLNPLLAAALLSAAVSAVFLTEVLAPALLRLPDHHCVYDLPREVPESLVGLGLFVFGFFAIGWACVLNGLARCEETSAILPDFLGKLLFLGLFGYLGSLVLFSVELVLLL